VSKVSTRTQQIVNQMRDQSPTHTNRLVEELIGTLQVCNNCSCSLGQDEKVINARFI
jgi:hypothetical protein